MSNKNSAECDTKSDCGFYSEYWEEIVTHTNQVLLESDGESDLSVPLHHNSPSRSFENKKEKSQLSEIVLFPENNQTNLINCYQNRPLLQAQALENSRQFQAELSPELSDRPSKAYTPKIVSYVCDGSCNNYLYLTSKIPPLIIAEKLDKDSCYSTIKESHATDKLHQKQPVADYPPTAIQNKASRISFFCRKEEAGDNISCEWFEQSAQPAEVNKTPDKKSILRYSNESICSKNTTSSQLIKEHLDCSSESSYKTGSPQTEQTYLHASSAELTISLALETGTIDSIGSLAVNIGPSKAKVGNEDSQRHAFAFKCTDSEHNNLFKKLCISIIPSISYSGHLDTETQKQNTPFTKQTGFPKTLVEEVSQPLATHTKSPESSSPDVPTDQLPSPLKQWSARQLLASCKPTRKTPSSYLFIKPIPHHKTVPKAEVQKHQLKAFKPVKSPIFIKNKEVQKDKIFRNRPCIASKFNWPNTWAIGPFPSQSVKESVINELDYGPPAWATTTCHCSPLLDLTVDLFSERRYSGTEKFLRVHRKPCKQVGGGKVIPIFSSQYLLNPRSSFEKLQYLYPIRKKNCLKMQSILTSCLGQAEGRNKHERSKGEVCCTLGNSNARGNGPFLSCAPADGRHLITSPLSSSGNSYIQHMPALPPPSERRHSPAPVLQTERETWMLAGLCPNCKCRIPNSPYCPYIAAQPPKEKNMCNSLCMEKPNFGAIQVPCEDLVLKKFSACPCGNVPQHGLFPDTDISWSVKKKTRASPNINQRASMTELNKVNYPKGNFNTVEARCANCCTNCHHCLPTCFCFQNMNRQDASRNQFTKIQFPFENGFPTKNLKDFEEKSKTVKKTERKNRIHMGSDALQEFSPSDTHNVPPSKYNYRTSKYVMYCPNCCSGCQHLGTSKEVCNSYSMKQKMLKNCLNRKSVFLMDPDHRSRSHCKCSQEISLFHVDQADRYKINRAMLSKRGI